MKDDKNTLDSQNNLEKDSSQEEPQTQDQREDYYSAEDRLTTQDLAEIGRLVDLNKKNKEDNKSVKEENSVATPEESAKPLEENKEETESAETEKENKSEVSDESPKAVEDLDVDDVKPIASEIRAVRDEKRVEEPEAEENEVDKKPAEKGTVSNKITGLFVANQKKPKDKKPLKKPVKKNGKKAVKKTPLAGVKKRSGLPRRTPKKSWGRTLTLCLIFTAILGAIAATGIYLLYTANFTDISDTEYVPKEKTLIYTSDNVQIATLYNENRSYVSIEQVPQELRNALVATEDSRFYTHNGVDYFGVLRALLANVLGGNSTGQGASTLTQQLARLLYLPDIANESTFMDSLNRKFKEISISYQLEDKYTKDQILEMYLNEYYFGSAAYGIEAAAETYFGKNVSQLNLAESAMLAGLPQAPSVYAPNVDFEASKNRQRQVLQRMVDAGYINQDQADQAYNTPINIIPWSEQSINNQITPGYQDFVGRVIDEYAAAVAPTIMRERGLTEDEAESYARSSVASGGYKFYTTVNSKFQTDAIDTMQSSLPGYGYDQEEGYTGALVSVDRGGAIRAYYGGNEEYSDIDMANSPRQPGSNIKPLYYAMALERGIFTPDSVLNDGPISIGGYSPKNSDSSYMGPISFATSLIQSRNTTSVQIFNSLGTQAAVDWLKQYGFDSINDDDYNLATALGGLTYGLKPYQVAAAFNTFNDGGVYNQAYFIERVTTSNGETVLNKDGLGLVSKQIMSPSTATGMYDIMRGVVTGGTGVNAATALPTAGKTGTTDNEENLWFTGMTGNITTSIWLGHLDHYVIGGGSRIPASIYASYVSTLIGEGLVS